MKLLFHVSDTKILQGYQSLVLNSCKLLSSKSTVWSFLKAVCRNFQNSKDISIGGAHFLNYNQLML